MTSRRISPLRALLVILSLLLPASLSLGSAASAAGNADFRGHWLDSSCGWVITSEDFGSGAVTGTSDCTQFELTDGHVSGNSYSFTVTDGSYFSYNTGTFTSTTAIGHFNDTYGHSIDYTASRANGPSSTTVSCVPDAAGGAVDTCTVTVTTQPVDPTVTPTGTVALTSTGNGAFSVASCTLAAATPGTATCTAPYDLLGGTQGATSLPVVTATWAGDAQLATSVGTTTIQYVALSGVVDATDCSGTSCRYAGIPGQVLHISGGATPATATSAADGTWATQVQAGQYVVEPTDPGFVPDKAAINATSNTGQIDFAVCSSLSGSGGTSVQRLLAGAPPSHLGCPDAVDWKMPPRVVRSTQNLAQGGITRGLPKPGFVTPSSWPVELSLKDGVFPVSSCPKNETYQWKVVAPKGATVVSKPADGCSSSMKVSDLGTYTVTAQRYVKTAKGLKKTAAKPITSKVKVDDLLIVGLGDSNASGEGLPPFYFTGCNRGVASYQYQAALSIEQKMHGHTSVTFVSPACSGARTQHLVDTRYDGIDNNTLLAPQITALETLLGQHAAGPDREINALMMSIGINNIGFGPLLEYCVKYTYVNGRSCDQTPVTNVPDGTGGVASWDVAKKGRTLDQQVLGLIGDLPQRYKEVAVALHGVVAPSRVYLSQYPTEVYDDNAQLCSAVNSIYPTAVWKWLKTTGDALNAAVAHGAGSHGWKTLLVPDQAFEHNGYCAHNSWFVSLSYAFYNHNKAGAFHATARGAQVTADVAVRDICPAIVPRKADCTS